MKTRNFKIGIYIRIGCEEQNRNVSASIQESILRQAVDAQNAKRPFGKVVDVFADHARSGNDMNRPELQRLIQCVRQREINFVVTTDAARISRSISDFVAVWETLTAHDCELRTLNDGLDNGLSLDCASMNAMKKTEVNYENA